MLRKTFLTFSLALCTLAPVAAQKSWTADNGNGTFTNPLFYDEFSDPDIIRVGDDYYLAGTTMHCTPGVVILHSKDLVNWKFKSYAFDRFNMGDEFKLENGREAYGQGIWAPCIRYNDGKFYLFSNINGHGMQVFISEDAAGPWQHINLGGTIYDLSVLFDDDGRIYAVHGYDEVKVTEIKADFSGYVDGSERVIIPKGNAMGEGHHIYKIDGRYFILSADYAPMGRMQCARADNLYGPYETAAISVKETMGTERVHVVNNIGFGSKLPESGFKFDVWKPASNDMGCATLHQGGIVQLPNGDWWGVSMLDFRAVGRTVSLSPITWVDGWPYFGLEGNLGRSPRTWVKPAIDVEVEPHAPYERCDNFNAKSLKPVWQWNHEPVDSKWSLTRGKLRLNTMPSKDFLWAKNTLTQRGIGPVSVATVKVDVSNLKDGDLAGLGLLNIPYAYLGVEKKGKDLYLNYHNQLDNKTISESINKTEVFVRATGDFDNDKAVLSYSIDGGNSYINIGDTILLPYQLKTFQGTRYSLFAFNTKDKNGGYAEFDDFIVEELYADRTANFPANKIITLINNGRKDYVWANPKGLLHTKNYDANSPAGNDCRFYVHDRGNGRVVLEA